MANCDIDKPIVHRHRADMTPEATRRGPPVWTLHPSKGEHALGGDLDAGLLDDVVGSVVGSIDAFFQAAVLYQTGKETCQECEDG